MSLPTDDLAAQIRHQVRVVRQRMTWWIPLIFVTGLAVSVLGVLPSAANALETGRPTVGLLVFAAFTLLFGWFVFGWLMLPYRLSPRIVPYFARDVGEYRGPSMAAFPRGRAVYLAIEELDRLAVRSGVPPLSTFGFAYDHFGQEVRWHRAADGLATVEALQRAEPALDAEVAADLEALASVLGAAARSSVDFSLVVRLHATDSMQMVCTREVRQGSFW